MYVGLNLTGTALLSPTLALALLQFVHAFEVTGSTTFLFLLVRGPLLVALVPVWSKDLSVATLSGDDDSLSCLALLEDCSDIAPRGGDLSGKLFLVECGDVSVKQNGDHPALGTLIESCEWHDGAERMYQRNYFILILGRF